MNICIGIVSYLPNDKKVREFRFNKLMSLIKKCDDIFRIDIVILAQNWKDEMLKIKTKNSKVVVVSYKDKLGITGARKHLRQYFLESCYDYLVMLDDDSTIVGTREDALNYLNQIHAHPKMYGLFKEKLLKLFAISKEVFSLLDYPDGEAENGDFFEDMYLIDKLRAYVPDKCFRFDRRGIKEYSNSANDPYSTWFHRQLDKHEVGNKTRMMI